MIMKSTSHRFQNCMVLLITGSLIVLLFLLQTIDINQLKEQISDPTGVEFTTSGFDLETLTATTQDVQKISFGGDTENTPTQEDEIIRGALDVNVHETRVLGSIYRPGHRISDPSICPDLGSGVKILTIIISSPDHRDERDAIRMTWGHFNLRIDVSMAFILGQTLNETTQTSILSESDLYGDIIQGSFLDSYDNLTLKTLSILDWTTKYCPKSRFLLKTDDDVFTNMPNLLTLVEEHWNANRTMFGYVAKHWGPNRDEASKYYLPVEQYSGSVFPDFIPGTAYLVTVDCLQDIYMESLKQKFVRLEDILFTGIVPEVLNISRVDVKGFYNYKINFNTCSIKECISTHEVSYNEQFSFWTKAMEKESILC